MIKAITPSKGDIKPANNGNTIMKTMGSGRISSSRTLSNPGNIITKATTDHKDIKIIHVIFCGTKNVINCFLFKNFLFPKMQFEPIFWTLGESPCHPTGRHVVWHGELPPPGLAPLLAFIGLNANPVEPGSQRIVRLAHPYQLGNLEILRKPTSITEFLPIVKILTRSLS